MNTELDRERIEEPLKSILQPVKANYLRGPISRDRAYEALNALASATAIVITGCDDPVSRAFFDRALEQQLKDGA